MSALWTAADIAAATGGSVAGDFQAGGVAFDSREIGAGDLFVALKGETTDGHRFVAGAFERGAAGALVSEPIEGPHVLVADTARALDDLARAARARSAATVVGVTGSVGKTGTKEALAAALTRGRRGPVHRSVKSYNNHTGVPLSLARMPAASGFAVFEMGMNHPGELALLTRLVRPHVALVTAIAPAHAAFFPDEAAIADAKGEIFQGLEPGGTAVIPFDSPHRDRLIAAAAPHAGQVWTFGRGEGATVRTFEAVRLSAGGTFVAVRMPDGEVSFTLSEPGEHWISNATAVIAAVRAAGGDVAAAGLALAELDGLPGRGQRRPVPVPGGDALVIDESYNANPASMAATIRELGQTPARRRIVVLGGMRELGAGSDRFHADLAPLLDEAGVEHAILVGPEMAALASALERRIDFRHVADAAAAEAALAGLLGPGDAVLVKGSNAIGLARVVDALASGKITCST